LDALSASKKQFLKTHRSKQCLKNERVICELVCSCNHMITN
jgi:hypothetical protein